MRTHIATAFENFGILDEIRRCKYGRIYTDKSRTILQIDGGLNAGFRATIVSFDDDGIGILPGSFNWNIAGSFPIFNDPQIQPCLARMLREWGVEERIVPLTEIGFELSPGGMLRHRRGWYVIGKYALMVFDPQRDTIDDAPVWPGALLYEEGYPTCMLPVELRPTVYSTASGMYAVWPGDAGHRMMPHSKFFSIGVPLDGAPSSQPSGRQGDLLFYERNIDIDEMPATSWAGDHRIDGEVRYDTHLRLDVVLAGATITHPQHPTIKISHDCYMVRLPGWTNPHADCAD